MVPKRKTRLPSSVPRDHLPYNTLQASHLRKGMNILNRISKLSVDDLHKLQIAVLTEIQRRKQIAAHSADVLIIGEKQGKGGHSAAASKPRPAAMPPAPKRRAA
jgi:hypothetical protein